MNLSRRLERLESRPNRTRTEPLMIMGPGRICGWKGGGKEVLRRPGESDNELEARAKKETGSPVLTAIKERCTP